MRPGRLTGCAARFRVEKRLDTAMEEVFVVELQLGKLTGCSQERKQVRRIKKNKAFIKTIAVLDRNHK